MHATIKTIRDGLIGALRDFVNDAGFNSDLDLVVELVYELSEYREEDVPFYPSVYIVRRQNDNDALNMIAPGSERVALKTIEPGVGAGSSILKDSAALAEDGWAVFVDVSTGQIKYGLFRSAFLPISISSEEQMADPEADSGTAILIRNCSKNSVEILTSDGKSLELSMTSARPAAETIRSSFDRFATAVASGLAKESRESTCKYVKRLLIRLTQKCHGTMLVVLPATVKKLPVEFSDGVVLDTPIDLVSAFTELKEDSSAANFVRLSSRESLLNGMIQSDGITVMNSVGEILAFRVFVKPTDKERAQLDTMDVRGGARSRAFEILRLRIGNPLLSAFFLSQDGKTRCELKT